MANTEGILNIVDQLIESTKQNAIAWESIGNRQYRVVKGNYCVELNPSISRPLKVVDPNTITVKVFNTDGLVSQYKTSEKTSKTSEAVSELYAIVDAKLIAKTPKRTRRVRMQVSRQKKTLHRNARTTNKI